MKFIFDSDTIIFYLKDYPSVAQKVASFKVGELSISSMAYAEVMLGAYRSRNGSGRKVATTIELLELFSLVDFDRYSAEVFAEIKSELMKKGQIVEDSDLIIASTAVANGMTLVTNNEKHFKRIKGLKLENWYK